MSDAKLVVIYDGDCPFCQAYVKLMALRNRVGQVDIIDARSGDLRVTEIQRTHDLDEGMVAIFGSEIYYGSDAIALISSLCADVGFIQKLFAKVLSSPTRAKFLYPAMKLGRNATLRALGRSKIGHR
jgi:predicted DCC family thiol-disulfide oxidoreductase YuxK